MKDLPRVLLVAAVAVLLVQRIPIAHHRPSPVAHSSWADSALTREAWYALDRGSLGHGDQCVSFTNQMLYRAGVRSAIIVDRTTGDSVIVVDQSGLEKSNLVGLTDVRTDSKFVAQAVVSAAFFLLSIFCLLSGKIPTSEKGWAYGVLGTIAGFWLK